MAFTFDPLVFDPGIFDAVDVVPSLFKVLVPEQNRYVAAGQGVSVTIYIYNMASSPGVKYLFNPDTIPQVQIYRPDGTTLLAYTNMVQSTTGTYTYQHQVSVNDSKGPYTAQFKAVNGDKTMLSKGIVIFEVV